MIRRAKAVVLCSGGPASSVLAFLLGKETQRSLPRRRDPTPAALRQAWGLAAEGYELYLLSIDDNQPARHQARRAARLIAALLDAPYEVRDPATLPPLPASVAAAPHARLFTLAGVVAVQQETEIIAAGMHLGDSTRPASAWRAFMEGFNQRALRVSQDTDAPRLQLLAPLAECSLADLLVLGTQLGVPLESTWSCTAGGTLQCGRCDACVARQVAFHVAGVVDQTPYAAILPGMAGNPV